ncbi:MAG TPA: dephospho-CoA kinase [Candidatus Saccharimonadia bacterium]|nr:dephospho-CoA kinase [Candidatus Saccharimonadia bacterium]
MNRPAAYVVAVTGGVASGKSVVTDRLASHGAPVIDADLVSRELVEPGGPALAAIVSAFGDGVLGEDGRLDRRMLRAIVFADAGKRHALEAILHPRVERRMRELAQDVRDTPYVVLAIPLLAEVGRYEFIDRVVVVDAPAATQVERLVRRDGLTREQALAMLAAQATRDARLAIADDVLVNDGSLEALRERTDVLHAQLLARAARARG